MLFGHHAADVARAGDVQALYEHALATHGRIDAWVNNAGISLGYRPLDELSVTEIDDIVRINLLGHLYAMRLLVPYFREHGGAILNMAGRGYRGEGRRTPQRTPPRRRRSRASRRASRRRTATAIASR